jgi:hypothetical protein
MISEKKLLEIVVNATQCFIPDDRLTDEQKDTLNDIRYRLCNCSTCKKVVTRELNEPMGTLGHALRMQNSIGISRSSIKVLMGTSIEGTIPIFLLQFIEVVLHEIIHILYPEYDEQETKRKTVEWLNSFDWKKVVDPTWLHP